MSTIEIVLLIVGIIVFVASFLLPEKKSKLGINEMSQTEEIVQKSIEREIEQVRGKIEDVIEETITYSMEKTERTLERMTNEKIMAINEYSDTVLGNIHKNHDEVMFLHDMLNQKQQALKKTATEAQGMIKDIEAKVACAKKEVLTKEIMEKEIIAKEIIAKEIIAKVEVKKEPKKEKKTIAKKAVEKDSNSIAIQVTDGMQNSNEKILTLYKDGKSKMAIAKELGLGVGEVKLVIDLFEGM